MLIMFGLGLFFAGWSGDKLAAGSRRGWIWLLVLGIAFANMALLTDCIGYLPWNWFKTPSGCQDNSEYRQTFQHDGENVPQKAIYAMHSRRRVL
jgi:hypothetical protein